MGSSPIFYKQERLPIEGGACYLLLAAQQSLLWGSSPWPYAYRAHALPAELRRPCREAMEPDHLSTYDARPKSKEKCTPVLSLRSRACHHPPCTTRRPRCWMTGMAPLEYFCPGPARFLSNPTSSDHQQAPFPCARSKRITISLLSLPALSSRERASATSKCPSSKHLEVVLKF